MVRQFCDYKPRRPYFNFQPRVEIACHRLTSEWVREVISRFFRSRSEIFVEKRVLEEVVCVRPFQAFELHCHKCSSAILDGTLQFFVLLPPFKRQ
jgi:hypothetical protein